MILLHPASSHTPRDVAAVERATGRVALYRGGARVELVSAPANGCRRPARRCHADRLRRIGVRRRRCAGIRWWLAALSAALLAMAGAGA
ncbi:MAG: hypothetical protein OXB97_04535 [Rhodospirillales bacterium]|nr:hypothetical protein [Rhodospirillales bacterium]